MAKPGKRSKALKRPSYKKIIKQQELDDGQEEGIIDQIAALEALLGGGLPTPEETTEEKAVEPVVMPELIVDATAKPAAKNLPKPSQRQKVELIRGVRLQTVQVDI